MEPTTYPRSGDGASPRRILSSRRLWPVAVLLAAVACAGTADAVTPYRPVTEIHIGGEGWWDYLSVDPAARRLYVSHGTEVVVVDLDTNKVVGTITDTPGVHGLAVAPALGLGFASDGRESTASIVDLKTLKTISTVPTGENPDAILYVPGFEEVYTFNGRGHSATVFAAKTGKVVATIPLPGKPEFAVFDPTTGRIYNNIEDRSEVVAIDAKTHTIVATWPIAPGEEASGLAIDERHHRLFAGCHNELMVMMDDRSGKVLASVPIGKGVDACAFDPATGLAFASCGEGSVTIAHEDTPDTLKVVQTLPTIHSARTMALDPVTHRIYLSAADMEPAPAAVEGGRRQRPRAVPGSFRVLVYGPAKE
jgi:DNA-binding beta-propeller fold protein YncE